MDLMLPAMPNLRDEEGLPLGGFPGKTSPGQEYKYKEYREHVQENGGNATRLGYDSLDRNGRIIEVSTVGRRERPAGEATPPSLPPRNYGSQYRSEFHAKQQQQHQHHSPARARQSHTGDPASSRHHHHHHQQNPSPARSRQSQTSNASNSRTNLSQDMDGSLLDLADELGGGRASSTSLHSSSGRRSQTDLAGYARDMPNGKYSVSRTEGSDRRCNDPLSI